MSRLREAFAAARAEDRALLIGYLPAGFPDRDAAVTLVETMVENGVDVVEVGLPYSDPLMDGVVIQQAVSQALSNGCTTDDVLATVAAVARTGAPTLVMSYWNPLERYGVDRFAAALAAAGGVGAITPDLTPEEAGAWIAATDAHDLDRVFLVAPSSTDARIGVVGSVATGFVYAAATMGVTGARSSMATGVGSAAEALVARTRAYAGANVPVAVGVGIATAEQAAQVAAYADGVIVGAAFVRTVLEAPTPAEAVTAIGRLAADLAAGVRGATRAGTVAG